MSGSTGEDSRKPAAAGGVGSTTSSSSSSSTAADARYSFDPVQLEAFVKEKPWMKTPKYFEKVAISPSAVMKMMMHCSSGVEKGIQKGGNPIEVMGLLLGRPDPSTPNTLVVTDAFPLPIEGFETRVIADDQNVVNHMISLNECLERSRKEKFMGWYHSHPFDLNETHSHCFLSQTDLSTQLLWQRAEDPQGNPFVAIVLDPLRSIHTNHPELKAFRAYPPEYSSPIHNECPDGKIQEIEQIRLEHWGSCWNRYYELSVEYYMSSTSRHVLEQLTQNYLWMRTLIQSKTAMNTDGGGGGTSSSGGAGSGGGGGSSSQSSSSSKTSNLAQRINSTTSRLQTIVKSSSSNTSSSGGAGTGGSSGGGYGDTTGSITGGGRSGPSSLGRGDPTVAALTASTKTSSTSSSTAGGGGGTSSGGTATNAPGPRLAQRTHDLNQAVSNVINLATDELCDMSLTHTKKQVFQ